MYRVPFYERLCSTLKKRGIDLVVVYGQHSRVERVEDMPPFSCGRIIQNHYLHLGRRFLVWQPAMQHLKGADLVIVQQATRNLINYPLMVFRKVFGYKLAYWGHGRNLQASNYNSLGERMKRIYSVHVDHWFAYNDLSRDIVRNLGYPEDKITSVNNAIDTNESRTQWEDITLTELHELKRKYDIGEQSAIGVFCSRLYKEKRLDFLIQCVEKVKQQVSHFHFFVIGDGVDASIVKVYAEKNGEWFHWVGPMYGRKKVCYFKLAQFQLMPGLVGLHILDSLALLTPLITTRIDLHSPEIIYLENGINGIMTENSEEAYVREIVRFLQDKDYKKKLVEGCRVARKKYTIENMVSRFADGINAALSEQTAR